MKVKVICTKEVTSVADLMNADWNRMLVVELPTFKFAMFHEGRGFIAKDKDGFFNEGDKCSKASEYDTYEGGD